MEDKDLKLFAERYAAAWRSQRPASVAVFFAPNGSLTVNDRTPAVGRAAIAEVARSFMTAFPDMVVTFDRLEKVADRVRFHWTLTGTNTGPGGSGKKVRISGYESWLMNDKGLIANSQGYFDSQEYERQLKEGYEKPGEPQ